MVEIGLNCSRLLGVGCIALGNNSTLEIVVNFEGGYAIFDYNFFVTLLLQETLMLPSFFFFFF